MEHISFVLWLCLFPVSMAIVSYLDVKEDSIKPKTPDFRTEDQIKEDKEKVQSGISKLFCFYLFIAAIIY